jgi:hypothetical protein
VALPYDSVYQSQKARLLKPQLHGTKPMEKVGAVDEHHRALKGQCTQRRAARMIWDIPATIAAMGD